jgi:RNA polymerase sigma-70 factor (ECF subfamily)
MDAAGELYDRHNERIFRYVWARVREDQTAEDLTGEVFARMVTGLPGYRPTDVPFQAWLYRIAHNLIVDHYRKEGRSSLVPLQQAEAVREEGNSPASIVEQQLAIDRVRKALGALEPSQCEVILLRFLVGLPLQEVALTLDKSVAAVKGLQYRGLIALREQLTTD